MSERKSAEIKFRCTPSFKASLAASAEDASQSMSEFIEAAVGARQNVRKIFDMSAARSILDTEITPGFAELISTNTDACVPLTREDLDRSLEMVAPEPDSAVEDEFDSDDIVAVTATSWEDDEPPVDAEGNAVACTCRPWEFCTHKATG